MVKVLVLYYSSYGHVEQMARAQAEGAQRVADAQVTVKRVPELVSRDFLDQTGPYGHITRIASRLAAETST